MRVEALLVFTVFLSIAETAILTKFHVNSLIQFRYARTEVRATYRNPGNVATKAVFTMVIPQSAFISNFSMRVSGKEFVAEVKEKGEAKRNYDSAFSAGVGAGLVSQNTRDTNIFTVDVSLEPADKLVEFHLTYDEILARKSGLYNYIININPGVVVQDLRVEVNINESLPLSQLKVPEVLDSRDYIERANRIAEVRRNVGNSPNNGRVVFSPSDVYQEQAGMEGVAGKFVVKYDVDRRGESSDL